MTAEDRPGESCGDDRRDRSTLQIQCCGAPARIWLHIDDARRASVSVTAEDAAKQSMRQDIEQTIAYVPAAEHLATIRTIGELEIALAAARMRPAETDHYRHLLTETCRALDKHFIPSEEIEANSRTTVDEVPEKVRRRLRIAMGLAREIEGARKQIELLEAELARLKGGAA